MELWSLGQDHDVFGLHLVRGQSHPLGQRPQQDVHHDVDRQKDRCHHRHVPERLLGLRVVLEDHEHDGPAEGHHAHEHAAPGHPPASVSPPRQQHDRPHQDAARRDDHVQAQQPLHGRVDQVRARHQPDHHHQPVEQGPRQRRPRQRPQGAGHDHRLGRVGLGEGFVHVLGAPADAPVKGLHQRVHCQQDQQHHAPSDPDRDDRDGTPIHVRLLGPQRIRYIRDGSTPICSTVGAIWR